MNGNLLELYNNLNSEKTNIKIEESQKEFFETNFGKIINEGIDIGLKAILPDSIENDIIEIKDVLIEDGFKTALNEAIDKTVEVGKKILGIFTGDIKDITKLKEIFDEGEIINKVSELIDFGIEKATDNGLINKNISTIIRGGKAVILNIIEDRINNECNIQNNISKEIDNNIEGWYEAYKERDFNSMEKAYNNIRENLEKIVEIEDIITKAHQVENLHSLIKNNGKNFNLSQEEIELANQLSF